MQNDDENPFWSKERNYLVGYGKPPYHTRFKKGQAGNPKGRPKKPVPKKPIDRSLRDAELAFMESQVPIQKGDKREHITMRDAVRQKQAMVALSGNPHALKAIQERDERNLKDLNAEIEEDHEFWRNYINKYEVLAAAQEKTGEPMSEEWPHPDDLVFDNGVHVQIKGGANPSKAFEGRRLRIRLRYLMLLQSEWDRRNNSTLNGEISASEVVAIVINQYALPKRMQLDDARLIMQMDRISRMRKRELKRLIQQSWAELGFQRKPPVIIGAAKPFLEAVVAKVNTAQRS